jgi:hypothetical protein
VIQLKKILKERGLSAMLVALHLRLEGPSALADIEYALSSWATRGQLRYALSLLTGDGLVSRTPEGLFSMNEPVSSKVPAIPKEELILTQMPSQMVTSRGPVRVEGPSPKLSVKDMSFDPAARRVLEFYSKNVKGVGQREEQEALEVIDSLIASGTTSQVLIAAADKHRREQMKTEFRKRCAEFYRSHWKAFTTRSLEVKTDSEFQRMVEAVRKR